MEFMILLRKWCRACTIADLCTETGRTPHQIRGIITALREEGLLILDESSAPYTIHLTKEGLNFPLPGSRLTTDPIINYHLYRKGFGKISKHTSKRSALDAADKWNTNLAISNKPGTYEVVKVFAKHRSGQVTGPIERE